MFADEWTVAAIFSFLLSPRRTVSDRLGRSKEGDERCRFMQFQLVDDVGARNLIGGGSQRDDGNSREILFQDRQLGVFRAEIMSPMGDAMRFVDGNQRDVDAGSNQCSSLMTRSGEM